MKTFIFIPCGDDELDSRGDPNEFVKLVNLHNLVGKKKSADQGALMRHAFDGMAQGLQKSETHGDEMVSWLFPAPEQEDEEWPYDKQTKSLMGRTVPVAPRMTT